MSSLLNLATSSDISPVVEGVETKQQLEYLQSLGCHKYQEYYFYLPLTMDELLNVIENDMASMSLNNIYRYAELFDQIQ